MSYKQVRSLARGMEVLKHLNATTPATVATIAEEARLPRPTVYRILETLVERGLVYRSPSSPNLYRLTGNVLALSAGLTDESEARAERDARRSS